MRYFILSICFCMLVFGQGSVQTPLGVYNSSAPTLTNGSYSPVQLDVNGNLKVNIVAGSSGNGAASATGSAVPAQADYQGLNIGGTLRGQTGVNPTGTVYAAQTDITSVAGATVVTGNGTAAGTLRVAIASDNTAFSVNAVQSGTWSVRNVGNAGAIFDSAQNAAAPANNLAVGGTYNSSQITTLTTGNLSSLQVDGKGNLLTRKWNGCPAGVFYEAGYQYLPNVSTSLTATTTCVDWVIFSNKDTANHTVTFQDQSTQCNTGVCQILTTFPLPPGGFNAVPLYGSKFTSGIKWNADAANVIVATVIGHQ